LSSGPLALLESAEAGDDADLCLLGDGLSAQVFARERVGGVSRDRLGDLTADGGLKCGPRVAVLSSHGAGRNVSRAPIDLRAVTATHERGNDAQIENLKPEYRLKLAGDGDALEKSELAVFKPET
jgi:hypothetical protein